MAIILGQVVMAHLAFNQYKSLTTQLTKEGDTHEEGRDGPAEERRNKRIRRLKILRLKKFRRKHSP